MDNMVKAAEKSLINASKMVIWFNFLIKFSPILFFIS
jgi:hypothetical protein